MTGKPPPLGATPTSSGAGTIVTPSPASGVPTPQPTAEPTLEKLEGRIAFSSSPLGPQGALQSADIYVMNADGSGLTQVTTHEDNDVAPAWSPDGNRIAFTTNRHPNNPDAGGYGEIYLIDPDGSNETRVTNNGEFDRDSAWSPDGRRILFLSSRVRVGGRNLPSVIFVMNVDGSDQTLVDSTLLGSSRSPAWSPDGNRIAFAVVEESRRDGWTTHIYVADADGDRDEATPLTEGRGHYANPDWSPDGSRIVFDADYEKSGVRWSGIMVMNADGSNKKPLTDGSAYDTYPTWSPDGRGIAFASDRSGVIINRTHINDIYVMYADGSGLTRLTDDSSFDGAPDWGPAGGG